MTRGGPAGRHSTYGVGRPASKMLHAMGARTPRKARVTMAERGEVALERLKAEIEAGVEWFWARRGKVAE
jgi:hypothetical protein